MLDMQPIVIMEVSQDRAYKIMSSGDVHNMICRAEYWTTLILVLLASCTDHLGCLEKNVTGQYFLSPVSTIGERILRCS